MWNAAQVTIEHALFPKTGTDGTRLFICMGYLGDTCTDMKGFTLGSARTEKYHYIFI